MAGSNVIWAEFAGHGYFAGPFPSSVIAGVTLVSGDIYDITFLWTNIYPDADMMIDNVGARLYVEGYSNREDVKQVFYQIPSRRFFSWELWDGTPVNTKLNNGDLHWADLEVIDKHNLIRKNYLLVKPFVIDGDMTNAQIADKLGYSQSWVDKLVPKVKEAETLYNENHSPTE